MWDEVSIGCASVRTEVEREEVRERESVCVGGRECVGGGGREGVCGVVWCVCVCVRHRGIERCVRHRGIDWCV